MGSVMSVADIMGKQLSAAQFWIIWAMCFSLSNALHFIMYSQLMCYWGDVFVQPVGTHTLKRIALVSCAAFCLAFFAAAVAFLATGLQQEGFRSANSPIAGVF